MNYLYLALSAALRRRAVCLWGCVYGHEYSLVLATTITEENKPHKFSAVRSDLRFYLH